MPAHAHPSRRTARLTSIALAIALALTTLVVAPTTARAHDSCAIGRPAASGVLGAVLSAVNVFSSFLETSTAPCADKYGEVAVQMDRDWQDEEDASDPEDPFTPQSSSSPQSNAPRTFAPCIRGMAADFFPCDGIDLQSHVSMTELGLGQGDVPAFVNDIWGWTDPRTRTDYALLGSSEGTVFVDISDDKRPVVLGIMPTASTVGGSSWRDIKVYADHAYVVSEHTDHGVQVFDLTRLRDWDGTYTTYEPDTRYTGHGSAHNININTDTGFAYSVGAGPTSQQLPYSLIVEDGPAAGTYLANGAAFGGDPIGIGGLMAIGEDGDTSSGGTTTDGCQPLVGFPAGAVAIVDRGACTFTQKAQNAQDAGATGVVVANNGPGTIVMAGSAPGVLIPAIMVSQSDGATIKAGLPATVALDVGNPPECGDGLHMIDIRDPKNPTYAGCFQDGGYVHDTQCVVYEGPDAEFRGRELCFNSNGLDYAVNGPNFVSVVDVTDKGNPVELSRLPYEGSGYSHQGWLTEDQRYFLHGDEGDEILLGVNTTTRVWDMSDLRNPSVIDVFVNDTTSIDHNVYTEGRYAYASNYTTGLRVYETSDVGTEGLEEVAFFDLYPENDNASFEGGTWSNFPYLSQRGIVAVSSIDRGLFILKPRGGGHR